MSRGLSKEGETKKNQWHFPKLSMPKERLERLSHHEKFPNLHAYKQWSLAQPPGYVRNKYAVWNEEEQRLNSFWLSEAAQSYNVNDEIQHEEMAMSNTVPNDLFKAPTNQEEKSYKKPPIKASPYVFENKRLKQARTKIRKITKLKPLQKRSRALDSLFEKDRTNIMYAEVIQRAYRAYLHRCYWYHIFRKRKAAIAIQRIWRGAICRMLVNAWLAERQLFASKIQSLFWGYKSRCRTLNMKQSYTHASSTLQRIYRGYKGRIRWRNLQSTIATTRIQCMWRGHRDRIQTHIVWLGLKITKIQKMVRGYFSRCFTKQYKRDMDRAATLVQKHFRGVIGRALRDQLLHEREKKNRIELLEMLHAEEDWYREAGAAIQKKIDQSNAVNEVEHLESELYRSHRALYKLEFLYLNTMQQRKQVSPRAIEQGWNVQIDKDIKEQRKRLTAMKLEILFTNLYALRKAEEKLEKQKARKKEFNWREKELERWRVEEQLDAWTRESHAKYLSEKKLKQQAIAAQRRRWRIQYYTKEGKPDLRRRDGYPWDATVYAGPEREKLSHQNIDLLALCGQKTLNNDDDHKGVEATGFGSSLQELMRKLEFVSSDTDMQRKATILDPILDVVESKHQEIVANEGYIGGGKELQRQRAAFHASLVEEERQRKAMADGTAPPASKEEVVARLHLAKRRQNERRIPKSGRIPWHLLDQLDVERTKLRQEKTLQTLLIQGRGEKKSAQGAVNETQVQSVANDAKKAGTTNPINDDTKITM